MTGLNQQVRHSPGSTLRERSQAASETTFESESGVRDISCFSPLQRGLHAMCQRGAFAELRCSLRVRTTFVNVAAGRKRRGISMLEKKRWPADKSRLHEEAVSEGLFSSVLSFKLGMLSASPVSGWHGLEIESSRAGKFSSRSSDTFLAAKAISSRHPIFSIVRN